MNWTPELLGDYKQCMNDIEYFAEKHIKVRHVEYGLVPLKLNDFQKQAIKDYNEKNVFAKYANRMEGKTTIGAIILLHHAIFNEYRVSLIMGPKLQASNEVLELIYDMHENLPEHIQAEIVTRNKTKLEFSNRCSIISAGNNTNSGRGRTLSNIYIDESEFMNTLDEVFTNLYPCISVVNKGKLFAFTSTRTSEYFRDHK
jgi:hypothetical protein